MATKSTLDASLVSIDILTVIDTEYIKKKYGPNNNESSPVGIDHSSQFLICTGARSVSGQGTADLSFGANVGDLVSFRGTSIYQNSDDAIIVYAIKKNTSITGNTDVFNRFISNSVTRKGAVQPNTTTDTGLPAVNVAQNFLSLDSKVATSGTEAFLVYIALYTLANDGVTQELYGYYYWDPTITVK